MTYFIKETDLEGIYVGIALKFLGSDWIISLVLWHLFVLLNADKPFLWGW